MPMKATALLARRLQASDGDAGFVADLFFDDQRWCVRHLVVGVGARLAPERMVLLSVPDTPLLVGAKSLEVGLTRDQIEKCPDATTEKTVSRRHEIARALSFGPASYWRSPLVRGAGIHPGVAPLTYPRPMPAADSQVLERAARFEERQAAKSHLRSMREVIGYQALASDGQAGAVDDFIVDTDTWSISGLVVDGRKWWPGGRVAVPAAAVEAIDWASRSVRFRLERESVKSGSPA